MPRITPIIHTSILSTIRQSPTPADVITIFRRSILIRVLPNHPGNSLPIQPSPELTSLSLQSLLHSRTRLYTPARLQITAQKSAIATSIRLRARAIAFIVRVAAGVEPKFWHKGADAGFCPAPVFRDGMGACFVRAVWRGEGQREGSVEGAFVGVRRLGGDLRRA